VTDSCCYCRRHDQHRSKTNCSVQRKPSRFWRPRGDQAMSGGERPETWTRTAQPLRRLVTFPTKWNQTARADIMNRRRYHGWPSSTRMVADKGYACQSSSCQHANPKSRRHRDRCKPHRQFRPLPCVSRHGHRDVTPLAQFPALAARHSTVWLQEQDSVVRPRRGATGAEPSPTRMQQPGVEACQWRQQRRRGRSFVWGPAVVAMVV
jgi:hypothetical protein